MNRLVIHAKPIDPIHVSSKIKKMELGLTITRCLILIFWLNVQLANSICHLHWVQYQPNQSLSANNNSFVHLDPHQSGFPPIIARSKIFGTGHLGLFHYDPKAELDDNYATFLSKGAGCLERKSKFDLLINPSNCSIQWSPMSKESSALAVSFSTNTNSIVGRTFRNGSWILCSPQDKPGKGSWICQGTFGNPSSCRPFVVSNIEEIQVMTSIQNSQDQYFTNVTISEMAKTTRAVVTDSIIDFIRNKADVTVTQTSTRRHELEKSRSNSVTNLFEVDVFISKDTVIFFLDISKTTTNGFSDRKFIQVERTLTIPGKTAVKSCTTLTITNLPIQTNFKIMNDSLTPDQYKAGTAFADIKSSELTFLIVPVNAFHSCDVKYETNLTLSINDIYAIMGLHD